LIRALFQLEVLDRLKGTAEAKQTPIGYLPTNDSLDTNGLHINAQDLEAITSVTVYQPNLQLR
jgi:GTP-dependent phosphoenolpyruvate carboxykinase